MGLPARIFQLAVTEIAKAIPGLSPVPSSHGGGWWNIVRDHFPGAWQRNVEIRLENVLSHSAVYACVTLIASDVGKLRIKLMQEGDGIWSETENTAHSPVLRKPNRYQNRIKFIEYWLTSKLIHGNTYALKRRDARGLVTELYILDPCSVVPLVAPNGDVYYELRRDSLSGLENTTVTVPASEIIHDIMSILHHPLIGVSPIYACALAAIQGLNIQRNSTRFFANGSQPGGILICPAEIDDENANRVKEYWEQNYTGDNAGRVAVLGDGMKYEAMSVNAVDAQLIEQLKWTAETICSCFHVPPYMIGVGPAPSYNNIEALSLQYYTQCLQTLIESLELCLDEGLALPKKMGIEFDLDGLLRMDTATKVKAAFDLVKAGIASPNEARQKFDYGPVEGGESPYLQQQNFSLAALAKRDTQDDPFKTAPAPAPAEPPPEKDEDEELTDDEAEQERFIAAVRRHAKHYATA